MYALSIVIPALEEEPIIAAAVERAWALGPQEVLVADGGSRDRTAELAEASGAVVVHSLRGRGVQQNAAARQARGTALLFLHADTWLAPQAAAQLEQALQRSHVVWGAFRQQIEARGRLYRWLEWGNACRASVLGLPYGDQGLFVRRAAFEQVGGFQEVQLMEDVFLARALGRLARPILLPGPIYVSARRWQRYGVLRQTLLNWALLTLASFGVPPDRLAQWYR